MKNNTPWLGLNQIKNQFASTTDNLNNLLDKLTEDDYDSAFAAGDKFTISGASGNVYIMEKVGSQVSITPNVYNANSGTRTAFQNVNFDGLDSLMDYTWSTSGVNANDFTGAQMLGDLQRGLAMNDAVWRLADIIQRGDTITVADAAAMLNSTNVAESDKASLLVMISATIQDGKISPYAFLQVLKGILEQADETIDSSSDIIMDTSSPFGLQSILSTVLSAVVQTIAGVAVAISYLIKPIIGIIVSALSSLFSLINTYVSNYVTVNPSANAPFVKGPVKYCQEYEGMPSLINPYKRFKENPCNTFICGPVQVFFWCPPGREEVGGVTNIDVNAFMTVGLDVNKVMRELQNHDLWEVQHDGHSYCHRPKLSSQYWHEEYDGYYTIRRWFKQHFFSDDSMYLDSNGVLEILSDPLKAAKYLCTLNKIWMGINIGCPSTWSEFPWYPDLEVTSLMDYPNPETVIRSTSTYGQTNGNYMLFLDWVKGPDYAFDFNNAIGVPADFVNCLKNLYNVNILPYASKTEVQENQTTRWIADQPYSVIYKYYSPNYFSFFTQNSHFGISSIGNDCGVEKCESIPVDRAISIPDVTTDAVAAVVAVTGIVIAGLIAVKTFGSKLLKKRLVKYQLNQSGALAKLRNDYIAHPADQTKYDALYKATKKYNLKAKLFGWATYDPINNWFDAPTGSTGVNSLASSTLGDYNVPTAVEKLMTIGATTNNINTGVSDLTSTAATAAQVAEVKNLIV